MIIKLMQRHLNLIYIIPMLNVANLGKTKVWPNDAIPVDKKLNLFNEGNSTLINSVNGEF
jgi:hypothetical protein